MTTKRANPTPRKEGMANIVAATIRLLETHAPQDVTLRDVADESGHGHRLIVEWFGSKGELFAEVFNQVFEGLVEGGGFFYADLPTQPNVRKVFQLFNFMLVNNPDFLKSARSGRLVEVVEERLKTNRGIPAEQAGVAARRLTILALGIALFSDFIELSDDDAVLMMQNEFKATTGFDMPDNPDKVHPTKNKR